MEDKKKQELEKMYALRAGLSVISQKCDYVTDVENSIETGSEKLENFGYAISSVDLDCGLREAEKMAAEAKKDRKTAILHSLLYSLFCPLAFPFIFCWFFFSANSEYKKALIKVEESKRQIEKNKNEKAQYQKQYNDFDIEISTMKTKYNEALIIANDYCNEIQDTMSKEYGSLLDKRDWENLDLIIYYYETGRADSVKEALQLVDNERRNNALIEAIGIATTEICHSIQSLGNVMIQGFASLSAQIEAQRVQITDAMSEIVTQQTLSNALLAKANVSSKEMVEQMKKLNLKVK